MQHFVFTLCSLKIIYGYGDKLIFSMPSLCHFLMSLKTASSSNIFHNVLSGVFSTYVMYQLIFPAINQHLRPESPLTGA